MAQEWLTPSSFTTFGGASFVATIVVNTIRALLKNGMTQRVLRWVVFAASAGVTVIAAALDTPSLVTWALVPVNTCLMFCTMLGMNEIGKLATTPKAGFAGRAPFFETWLG